LELGLAPTSTSTSERRRRSCTFPDARARPVLAPASFGEFGGDLLVGNFGDGQINAYEPQPDGSFEHVGALRDDRGRQIAIDGLWALEFGNGAAAGPRETLFFTTLPGGRGHLRIRTSPPRRRFAVVVRAPGAPRQRSNKQLTGPQPDPGHDATALGLSRA
jgi:hypothetical protein